MRKPDIQDYIKEGEPIEKLNFTKDILIYVEYLENKIEILKDDVCRAEVGFFERDSVEINDELGLYSKSQESENNSFDTLENDKIKTESRKIIPTEGIYNEKKKILDKLNINYFKDLIGSRVLYQGYKEAIVTGWDNNKKHYILEEKNTKRNFISIASRLERLPELKE